VKTYDPADRITYVHMPRDTDPYAVPVETGWRHTRLPTGYANRSRRTDLRQPRLHSRSTPRERTSDR
jgi:hypothetical protein